MGRSVFSRIFCKERVREAGQEEGDCLAWIQVGREEEIEIEAGMIVSVAYR
jgi:hypothetical protein